MRWPPDSPKPSIFFFKFFQSIPKHNSISNSIPFIPFPFNLTPHFTQNSPPSVLPQCLLTVANVAIHFSFFPFPF
jgi:hypothetical protein